MLTHQTLSLSECDIKFAASEGTFSGYGSVFGNVDSYDDVIMAGAYSEVLKKDQAVPVYVNHGWLDGKLPVGSRTVRRRKPGDENAKRHRRLLGD